eukprot:3009008-Rhodomonas_salina.1
MAHLDNYTDDHRGCGQDNGIPLRGVPSTNTSVATPDRWGADAAMQGHGGINAVPLTHGSNTRLRRPATQAAPSCGRFDHSSVPSLPQALRRTASTSTSQQTLSWQNT